MNSNGEILIIDDDSDDSDLIHELASELLSLHNYRNTVSVLSESVAAMEYIKKNGQRIFLILSDINMPMVNGLELRRAMLEDIEVSSLGIPFVFLTSDKSLGAGMLTDYALQGYFSKPNSLDDLRHLLSGIIHYWKGNVAH